MNSRDIQITPMAHGSRGHCSGYLVAGGCGRFSLRNDYLVVVDGWIILLVAELSIAATWSFVDVCRALRGGYLVTRGWMLSLLVDALPPWLHPTLLMTLA